MITNQNDTFDTLDLESEVDDLNLGIEAFNLAKEERLSKPIQHSLYSMKQNFLCQCDPGPLLILGRQH